MVKRLGGIRRKSRKLMTKPVRKKGKVSLTRMLADFKEGDRVCLMQEPSVHKGQYHLRFYGKVGIVQEKRGRSFAVKFKDGNKEKTIITLPVHLKRLA